jgi:hypothetical protein
VPIRQWDHRAAPDVDRRPACAFFSSAIGSDIGWDAQPNRRLGFLDLLRDSYVGNTDGVDCSSCSSTSPGRGTAPNFPFRYLSKMASLSSQLLSPENCGQSITCVKRIDSPKYGTYAWHRSQVREPSCDQICRSLVFPIRAISGPQVVCWILVDGG